MKQFFFIAAFFTPLLSTSQAVVINQTDNTVNLANHSYYVEDEQGKLTRQEVLKKEKLGEFKKITAPVINFGVTASAFWIKCNIKNETNEKLLAELGNTTLTDIQLYEIDSSGGLVAKHVSGNWQPFRQRETGDVNYQFQLSAQPHRTETLLLRVLHYRGTQFPFTAGTKEAFYRTSNSRSLFEGMYYGLMLLMVLYNLFIYLSLKDNSYLFYVLYVFFMGFFNAVISGYAFKFLWPSAPYLNQYAEILACLTGVSGFLFAMYFLQTRQNTPLLHKLFWVMLSAYIANAVIIVSGYFMLGDQLLGIISISSVLLLLITGHSVLQKGYEPARYFLVAWSVLLVSVVIFILKDYNLVPYNSTTRHSMQIGSALEALLLSLALANRINVLKKEKEEAHLETLRSLEENKRL
ncbi:MAG: hypothetical protein ICV66_13070, partial [Chitinophagaceae bacterium]|nr:hypothetical protein [Chitinophagaceae bacterium]